MTEIQAVFDNLNDVEASISRFTREIRGAPTRADQLALKSYEVRRDELRAQLDEIASAQLIDLCDYRIMPTVRGRYPVRAVAGALEGFQDMVTNFFGAIRDKPKERARFDAEIVAASTLNVGYAYAGSLGFVLYAPNEQFLASETDLDIAVRGILDLVDQREVEGVRALAEQFGKSSIRAFYNWSKVHLDNGFDADIKWQRGSSVKLERVVQRPELEKVRVLIDSASDRVESTHTFHGMLSALDFPKRTFGFLTSDGNDLLRGPLDRDFNMNVVRRVGANYTATVRKTLVHRYYTDEDLPTWALISLEDA